MEGQGKAGLFLLLSFLFEVSRGEVIRHGVHCLHGSKVGTCFETTAPGSADRVQTLCPQSRFENTTPRIALEKGSRFLQPSEQFPATAQSASSLAHQHNKRSRLRLREWAHHLRPGARQACPYCHAVGDSLAPRKRQTIETLQGKGYDSLRLAFSTSGSSTRYADAPGPPMLRVSTPLRK